MMHGFKVDGALCMGMGMGMGVGVGRVALAADMYIIHDS